MILSLYKPNCSVFLFLSLLFFQLSFSLFASGGIVTV